MEALKLLFTTLKTTFPEVSQSIQQTKHVTYILSHVNVNKKPSDKLCRTIPLQIAEFEGLVRGHLAHEIASVPYAA